MQQKNISEKIFDNFVENEWNFLQNLDTFVI